jgi:hypothetical protein
MLARVRELIDTDPAFAAIKIDHYREFNDAIRIGEFAGARKRLPRLHVVVPIRDRHRQNAASALFIRRRVLSVPTFRRLRAARRNERSYEVGPLRPRVRESIALPRYAVDDQIRQWLAQLI